MNFIEFQNVTFGYSDDSEAQRIEENVIENMNLKIEKASVKTGAFLIKIIKSSCLLMKG